MSDVQFSVRDDDPFVIFQKLQTIARQKHGENGVIDLSRGDPGYGFVPSRRGREFASFILWLDSALNASPKERFLLYSENDLPEINQKIKKCTTNTYATDIAESLLSMFEEFIQTVIQAAADEGKKWSTFSVISALFSYAPMSGGSYLDPRGQEISRILTAAWHRKELSVKLSSNDILLTSGASHAIGTIFRALGDEGCGYLKHGDGIIIASPVYAPYNSIIEERGLVPIPFSVNPVTGIADISSIQVAMESLSPKALFLIDSNNPTGFSLPDADMEKLAAIAKKYNLIIITDEVYASFFPKKKSMLLLCPERTIAINSRSKVERSTGIRFGEIMTTPEGRTHIAEMLGLSDAKAFEKLLIFSKAPGATGGQFQHTTFVPGPSQLLGISSMVLGGIEREEYMRNLRENCSIFCSSLSLAHSGNTYYVIFDLDSLPGCKTQNLIMEERLLRLAKEGIIYIPAYRFFSEKDRGNPGVLTSVRASVVNTTPEKLREATERTIEVLC